MNGSLGPTPLEVWTPEAWMQSRRASAPAPSMGSPFAVGMDQGRGGHFGLRLALGGGWVAGSAALW